MNVCVADDYRAQVDKYNGIRVQFEARMMESCKRYQEVEEVHLKQMKDFVKIYASAWRLQRHLLEQVSEVLCHVVAHAHLTGNL